MALVEELNDKLLCGTGVFHVNVPVGVGRENTGRVNGSDVCVILRIFLELNADVGTQTAQAKLHALSIGYTVSPDLPILVVRNSKICGGRSNLAPKREIPSGVREERAHRQNRADVGGGRNQKVKEVRCGSKVVGA